MIDKNFLICTECLKTKKKPKRFSSIKNINIHLARKHQTRYKIKVEKSKVAISRLKRPQFKNNLH